MITKNFASFYDSVFIAEIAFWRRGPQSLTGLSPLTLPNDINSDRHWSKTLCIESLKYLMLFSISFKTLVFLSPNLKHN